MGNVALWQIEIFPAAGHVNRISEETLADAIGVGIDSSIQIDAHHGFLVQAEISQADAEKIASNLLVEPVVESHIVASVGDASLNISESNQSLVYVLSLIHI